MSSRLLKVALWVRHSKSLVFENALEVTVVID